MSLLPASKNIFGILPYLFNFKIWLNLKMFSFNNVVKHFTLSNLEKYKKHTVAPFCDWVVGPVAEVDRLVVEAVSHQFDYQSQWLAGLGCSVAKIVGPIA